MKRFSQIFPITACLSIGSSLVAHEFWLQPEQFSAPAGSVVNLTIQRGEDFTGDVRPINSERVVVLRHYSASGVVDEMKRVPAAPGVEKLPFSLAKPGTHLLVEDSAVSTITLSADKFLAYLRDDGLNHVEAARKEAKKDNDPGRERYLRCVKTLIKVGGQSDQTYATRTGQRLEIVPQSDPLTAKPGAKISFTVYFDGKPLVDGLVRTWHHREKTLMEIKGRTAADGSITFELPYAGVWMVSLVHMIPITDIPGFDWQSYWGNLTFEISS